MAKARRMTAMNSVGVAFQNLVASKAWKLDSFPASPNLLFQKRNEKPDVVLKVVTLNETRLE